MTTKISKEAILIRPYNAQTDTNFVYSTWLRNYKHSSYFAKRIKPSVFFAGHHAVLNHLLAKPAMRLSVACDKNDPETIWGWLACEPSNLMQTVVHFMFVKDAFRKMGIARTLLNAAGVFDLNKTRFTHWTYPVDEFIRQYPDMLFDPYAL